MKTIISLTLLAVTLSIPGMAQRKSESTTPEVAIRSTTQNSKSSPDFSFVGLHQYEGFVPQTPVIFSGDIPVWSTTRDDVATKESMLKLVNNQDKLKRMLPDFSIDYYIRKIGTEGDYLHGMSGVTGSPGAYEIIYDITKSTTVPTMAPNAVSPSSFVKVGVGMRIKANIITSAANIEVSNLNHLALAEAAGQLKGGLSFSLFGIVGEEVINMAPNTTAMINLNSIDQFMQAIAILKSRLYDDKVALVPRVFAVQRNSGDMPAGMVASTTN